MSVNIFETKYLLALLHAGVDIDDYKWLAIKRIKEKLNFTEFEAEQYVKNVIDCAVYQHERSMYGGS